MPSEWRKGSKSGGNDGGNCAWVGVVTENERNARAARVPTGNPAAPYRILALKPNTYVLLRDEHGNVCQYTATEWKMFLDGAKAGEFDSLGGITGVEHKAVCVHTPDGGNHPQAASV